MILFFLNHFDINTGHNVLIIEWFGWPQVDIEIYVIILTAEICTLLCCSLYSFWSIALTSGGWDIYFSGTSNKRRDLYVLFKTVHKR